MTILKNFKERNCYALVNNPSIVCVCVCARGVSIIIDFMQAHSTTLYRVYDVCSRRTITLNFTESAMGAGLTTRRESESYSSVV